MCFLFTIQKFIGIKVHNERIPSGVFSALQNANITDSVVNSYNDVNLRWIGKDKWKYSLDFNSKLFRNYVKQLLLTIFFLEFPLKF